MFDYSFYLLLVFYAYFQGCVLKFMVAIIENAPRKYALSYTYIRYLRIILGQKYYFLLPYVPNFGQTKMFDFITCVCPV